MAKTPKAQHCRFYNNGESMTMNVPRQLTDEIKGIFHPHRDYSAVYDPKKEILIVFVPKPPV